LRASFNGTNGDLVNASNNILAGAEFTKEYTYTIPADKN
jgi:hypothetical protein